MEEWCPLGKPSTTVISDKMQICGDSNISHLNKTSQISKLFCIIPWISSSGFFIPNLEFNTHITETIRPSIILMYNRTGCHGGGDQNEPEI